MFRLPRDTAAAAILAGVVVCLPVPVSAQVAGEASCRSLGVSGYILDGVFDNLTDPWVPSTGLPMGVGLRSRGVFLRSRIPGFRQEIQLLNGTEMIRFQTLYGTRPIHRPAALTLDDYLERVRREQSRRLLVGGFLVRRMAQEAERSGSLLDFEIPITIPRGLESVVGEGGAGLTISGNRNIRFAGRSEWTEGAVSTATAYQTKFPTLNMEQESQFRITGTIGSKIEVSVDQDSRALTDLENRINISYRGYEDEIIQEVVAGNTDFRLPGSQFLGFNQSAQGLFGIKGRAQLGDLHLIALATQEKGTGEKATFRAGARENTIRRPDIEPLLGTYYFLDLAYQNRFPDRVAVLADSITAISVFIDDQKYENDVQDAAKSDSRAHFDLTNIQPEGSRETHIGSFHELDPEEYYVNRALGVLALNVSLGPKDVLGVVYQTQGGNAFGRLPGAADSTLVMKLIKPPDARPEDPTWEYELRNVYYLGSRNIPAEGFGLKIYYNPPSGEDEYTLDGTDYLKILGLDQWGEVPGTPADGNIDLNINYLNLARGELIFPSLRPFEEAGLGTDRQVDMYDTIDRLTLNQESKYYLEIKTATRATSYTLPATGILEGSEVVTLNGRRLQRGSDYRMNYLTGELTFLIEEIQDPTADVTVDYEYSPLIQLDQKVLMGLRTEYDLGRNGTISAMLVNRSEQTLDQRVRLGREPSRNLIWDATAQLEFRPDWLTRAVDALPMVATDAPSLIQFEAEVARSNPDPNTRGEALVEDFEGSKDTTGFGVGRGRWFLAAAPPGISNEARARFVWFNPYERIPSNRIWPDRETDIRSSQVNVLTLAMVPERPSPYPAGAYQWDTIPLDQRWGGVQQTVGAGAADLSRLSFIELWVNGDGGRLHIDLGTITEDAIPNGGLDTEDLLDNGVRNGVVDSGEDVGLDGRTGADEFDYFLIRAGETPAAVAAMSDQEKADRFGALYSHPTWYADLQTRLTDPSLDDFRYTPGGGYSRINGTENNQGDPDRLGRPDTEDINGNGYLDRSNSFYSYVIDLSPDSADSVLVAGGDRDTANWDDQYQSWRLYRVPLSAFGASTGSPDLSLVENVRLWVDGAPDSSQVTISIASFDVVGNQWRGIAVLDTAGVALPPETLQVSVKNTFDNPEYEPPPGVRLVRDPLTNLTSAEQSLALTFFQLPPSVEAEAFNPLGRPEDFTQYQGLGMYIHGPAGVFWAGADTSYVEAFLRFGADENNFYEYRAPVFADWDERNEIDVDFQTVTTLKEDLLAAWAGRSGVPDTTVGRYRVRGRPSLTNIRRLSAGIVNNHPTLAVDGEVWLNELRVLDVRREAGSASRMTLRTSVGDIATVDVRLDRQTADFQNLRQKRGTQRTTSNSTISVRAALDRFLPASWGLSMPMTVNKRNTLSLPKYQPGSDRVLPSGERTEHRTENSDESLSLTLRKDTDSSNPLVAWTLDRMIFNWTGSRRDGVSPVNPLNKAFQVRGNLQWDLNPDRRLAWHPLKAIPFLPAAITDADFNPLPTELNYRLDLNQAGEQIADPSGTVRRRFAFTGNETFTVAVNPYSPIRSRYMLTYNRDLTTGWTPGSGNLGREVGRRQTFNTTWEPRTFSWLNQRYQFDTDYRENNDPRYNSQVVQTPGGSQVLDLGRDVNASANASANYTFTPSQIVGAPRPDEGMNSAQRFLNDIKKLMRMFAPVVTNYSHQRTANLVGLQGRPVAAFRLGLSEDPHVERTSTTTTQQSLILNRRRLNINTMMNLPLQAQLGFRPDWLWTDQESQSKTTFTSSITWPSVSLNWLGLQRLWIFPDITRALVLSTNFQKTDESTDWINDALGGVRQPFSSRSTVRWAPLYSIQATLPNGMGINFSRSTTDMRLLQRSLSQSEARSHVSDLRFMLSYSFSAPEGIRLPLIGEVRFNSQLTLSLNMSVSENETKVRTPADYYPNGLVSEWNGFTPTASQATWSFQPSARYNFSRRVQGGFDMTFQNVNDRLMQRNRKVREVALFVNLLFN